MFLERIPVRFRLSLVHTAWISVLFSILGIALFKFVEYTLMDSVDSALLSSAYSVRDLAKMGGEMPQDVFVERLIQDHLHLDNFLPERIVQPYAQVISIGGRERHRTSTSTVTLPITLKAAKRARQGSHTLETFTFKGRPSLRQVTLPIMHDGHFSGDLVQVGATLGPTQNILKGTAALLRLLLPLVLLISVILGYMLTAQALKPVVQMTQAAAKMGAGDPSVRLGIPLADDELQELALTFNKMLDRLEDAISRLRRFTADVSHELRTPLAVLRGETELALRRLRSPEEYQSSLQSVLGEAKNMSTIVDDLLLLARAESGHLAFAWEVLPTKPFVADLVHSIEPIFKDRDIRLELACQQPEYFACSRTYLALALKNILLNASKHSAPGSSVYFGMTQEGSHLQFAIRDEGEGIQESDLPYIFDPFYRCDTARNRASGGSGIGLSLTQSLIKLHKGEIKVSSVVGRGTTFCVQIPHSTDCG